MTAPPAVFRTEIRLLLQAALLFFVLVVVIGILNGTDLVDFDRQELLTHVHAGTLGWITLAVFAATLWLFAGNPATDPRRALRPADPLTHAATALGVMATAGIALYAYQFLTTYGLNRPRVGMFVVAVIAGYLVWVALRARALPLSVPRLGIVVALATSISGGTIGVLAALQLATGDRYLPDGGFDAHPATMVVGFLVPVGMALAEWTLRPASADTPATRAGRWQMVLLFAGGVILMIGLLADAPPLIGLNLPFEVAAVVIFFRRLWPDLRGVRWTEANGGRHSAAAAALIVVNIGLLVYLIGRYQGDLDQAPTREILALDHVMFIGVMTNALFAMLYLLTGAGEAGGRAGGPIAHVIFWGMHVGLAGFAVGLFADVTALKIVSTPILGTAILLAVAQFSLRLHAPAVRGTVAPEPVG